MASVLNVASKANCALLAMTGGLHSWLFECCGLVFSAQLMDGNAESLLYAEQQRINNVRNKKDGIL